MRRDTDIDLDRLRPTELERTAECASIRRHRASVVRWRPTDPIGFNVAIIEPASPSHGDACIVPMSHDYRIDRMLLERLTILADVTRHRVVAVETPGVTMLTDAPHRTGRTSVPFGALRRAARGDYSGIAALQRAAIDETTGLSITACRIMGESLGAQLAASLAAASEGARSLDLVEPVNSRPLSLREMWNMQHALTGVETERKAAYVARNSDTGWGDVLPFEITTPENARVDRSLKKLRRQGRYVMAVALGLRRGLPDTLRLVEKDVPIRTWVAAASEASDAESAFALSMHLHAEGRIASTYRLSAPRSWPAGIGHHALTDFDLMYAFSVVLARSWAAPETELPVE